VEDTPYRWRTDQSVLRLVERACPDSTSPREASRLIKRGLVRLKLFKEPVSEYAISVA
jgi:hypothetical protein